MRLKTKNTLIGLFLLIIKIFHREKIPLIYFGVPDHNHYHRSTDTYLTINKSFYIESV